MKNIIYSFFILYIVHNFLFTVKHNFISNDNFFSLITNTTNFYEFENSLCFLNINDSSFFTNIYTCSRYITPQINKINVSSYNIEILSSTSKNSLLYNIILNFLLPVITIFFIFKKFSIEKVTDSFSDIKINNNKIENITINNFIGCSNIKKEIQEIIMQIKFNVFFNNKGCILPKGILLLGPPGCGKTHLVKTIINATGINYIFTSGSDINKMFVGSGSLIINQMFKKARENKPCLIFIDEADTIIKKREYANITSVSSEFGSTLCKLLAEMDSLNTENGVLVIFATNMNEQFIDKAVVRAGRVDKIININEPTFDERIDLFKMYLNDLYEPNKNNINLNKLAKITNGLNGSDINKIVNATKINKVNDYIKNIIENTNKINNTNKTNNNTDEINNNTDEINNNTDEINNNTDEINNNTDEINNNTDEINNNTDEINNNTDEINNNTDEINNNIDKTNNNEINNKFINKKKLLISNFYSIIYKILNIYKSKNKDKNDNKDDNENIINILSTNSDNKVLKDSDNKVLKDSDNKVLKDSDNKVLKNFTYIISTSDLDIQVNKCILGLEREKKINNQNRKLISYHETGHAIISFLLKDSILPTKICISITSKTLGYTMYSNDEEDIILNTSLNNLLRQVMILYGGRCAEIKFMNEVTCGAEDDYMKARKILKRIIMNGMLIEEYNFVEDINSKENKVPEEIEKIMNKVNKFIINEIYKLYEQYKLIIEDVSELIYINGSITDDHIREVFIKYNLEEQIQKLNIQDIHQQILNIL